MGDRLRVKTVAFSNVDPENGDGMFALSTAGVVSPPLAPGEMFDAGITIYLSIVGLWFFAQQPPIALAPLFFADPAGDTLR